MIKPLYMRPLIDRFARVVITVGGLATILSILGIFFFLFREVTPLFSAPTAKLTQRLIVPSSLTEEGPVQVGVDEHREIAQILTSGGLQFIDLGSDQPIPLDLPLELKNKRLTAMAHGGGAAPRYAVGTTEGEVLLLKVGTTTEFSQSGERRKRPMIRAGRPVTLAKGPIANWHIDLTIAEACWPSSLNKAG
jgi:phosphate transport system permease protein